MRITPTKQFDYGYNPITRHDDQKIRTLMDFGVLILTKDQVEESSEQLERAYLLVEGTAAFEWDGKRVTAQRESYLQENPWCLHVPAGMTVKVTGVTDRTEISITKTVNPNRFAAKMYTPAECRSEKRGQGTMNETSTRIVRTVFDYSNAPYANLVVGEVINFPGRWSSYPPHHHPQPEIYYYKFYPQNGYGFAQLGDNVLKVKDCDTVLIINDESHPQATAPGYAMYYVWVIRHLDGNPYITPTFEPEHLWVTDSAATIWNG
jgi:5-deoxy-glucuronate isomerase